MSKECIHFFGPLCVINIGRNVHVGSSISHLICTEVTRNITANELKNNFFFFFFFRNSKFSHFVSDGPGLLGYQAVSITEWFQDLQRKMAPFRCLKPFTHLQTVVFQETSIPCLNFLENNTPPHTPLCLAIQVHTPS